MSTSLLRFDLNERKRIASGALSPLAAALRAELEPLIGGPLPVPERKARLTRIGGRCALDGVYLQFNPYSPHEHECPQCHRVYVGDAHHDWWAMGAQLWCAERAVQAATLNLLCDDAAAGALSIRILTEFAVRYRSWPNRDNALGPTRPFFSTYLESIWLLNICHAVALLEAARPEQRTLNTLGELKNVLVEPSRDLIASFNEGRSNRQVWNEVAILSASRVLGLEARDDRKNGVYGLISNGLLADGSWYEGENYHLFAHRGLWYGVQLMRALDRPISNELNKRYAAGFVAPFLGLLPDDTFPSRRDSQYKVSIRQWRFAEWCELGLAHSADEPRLAGLLQRIYASGALPHTGRHPFSTADAERNEAPSSLSRADLSWRALLMANEELPSAGKWQPSSVCLPEQGLAVLRRDEGRMYVALEGGHTGGGHGHPDRLSLSLQYNHSRWLEDPGTGSYVERALHWYRSTLAHFAPLFDGASQIPRPATLLAFEERGGAGWISKRVEGIAPGTNATRTVVVADGYLIDVFEWDSDEERQVDLPIARVADLNITTGWTPANADGAKGLEDGFDFLTDVEMVAETNAGVVLNISGEVPAIASYVSSHPQSYWRAEAPGSPGQQPAPIHWLRTRGKSGRIVGLWGWNDAVERFGLNANSEPPTVSVTTTDGTTAVHAPTSDGWHIALTARHATSSVDLLKITKPITPVDRDAVRAPNTVHDAVEVGQVSVEMLLNLALAGRPISGAARFQLGEKHYVRTEQDWNEAGAPVATVQVARAGQSLLVDVLARTGAIVVPDANSDNELDNERRDVNSDGVQIHLGADDRISWSDGWLAVPAPETAPAARVTALSPSSGEVQSYWVRTSDGWAMRMAIPMSKEFFNKPFALEVVVNERSTDRLRRRGQLVLSGGGGFGYLRGDRTEPAHAIVFRARTR